MYDSTEMGGWWRFDGEGSSNQGWGGGLANSVQGCDVKIAKLFFSIQTLDQSEEHMQLKNHLMISKKESAADS